MRNSNYHELKKVGNLNYHKPLFLGNLNYHRPEKVRNCNYHGHPTEKMIKKTERILKFLNLSHLKESRFGELSHGEQKRVLIARALVFDPRILVFDEACTGLDVAAREVFLSTVEKLVERGHNIIFVTHHIEEVIPAINKVLFLKEGEISGMGDKDEMLKASKLNCILDYKFKINKKNGRYWLSL